MQILLRYQVNDHFLNHKVAQQVSIDFITKTEINCPLIETTDKNCRH